MTPADIRRVALLARDTGSIRTADVLDALADVMEAAQERRQHAFAVTMQDPKLNKALDRVEALKL